MKDKYILTANFMENKLNLNKMLIENKQYCFDFSDKHSAITISDDTDALMVMFLRRLADEPNIKILNIETDTLNETATSFIAEANRKLLNLATPISANRCYELANAYLFRNKIYIDKIEFVFDNKHYKFTESMQLITEHVNSTLPNTVRNIFENTNGVTFRAHAIDINN